MRSEQRLLEFDSSIMDPDTFKLIRKLCAEFQLHPDVEFTCYEAYMEYFKHLYTELETQLKQTTLEPNGGGGGGGGGVAIRQTSQLIERALDRVEKTSLLHTLALISICAKYVNGFRCEQLFKDLPKYLQRNGTPYSTREIRNTEYLVFKLLGFNVSRRRIKKKTFDVPTMLSLYLFTFTFIIFSFFVSLKIR